MVLLGLAQNRCQSQFVGQIARVLHDVDFRTLLSRNRGWAPIRVLLAAVLNKRAL